MALLFRVCHKTLPGISPPSIDTSSTNSYMWLTATILESTDTEHCYQFSKCIRHYHI